MRASALRPCAIKYKIVQGNIMQLAIFPRLTSSSSSFKDRYRAAAKLWGKGQVVTGSLIGYK